MGLSVSYRYRIKADAAKARRLIERLHAFAKRLPFDSVTEVREYDPPDGEYVFRKPSKAYREWKPGTHYLTRRRFDGLTETVEVPALHAMSFVAHVRGAETAEFGLASHPPVVVHHEDIITPRTGGGEDRRLSAGVAVEFPTRLRGWYSWSQFCKTQYAAHPRHGGVDNFLRAHLLLFAMIDECQRLGMTTRIRDDGKYWRHRDRRKLLKELRHWDELIAGVVGRLTDLLPDTGTTVAPIKERPDFEHLEARGAARLRKRRKT